MFKHSLIVVALGTALLAIGCGSDDDNNNNNNNPPTETGTTDTSTNPDGNNPDGNNGEVAPDAGTPYFSDYVKDLITNQTKDNTPPATDLLAPPDDPNPTTDLYKPLFP
jgi:hypothetical protein